MTPTSLVRTGPRSGPAHWRTFAIVGLGRIGTATALRARGLGFRTVFHDPYVPLGIERAETLHELLAQADVLSLHTPLTAETRGLIGEAEIGKLPAGAIVINTARAPWVEGRVIVTPHAAFCSPEAEADLRRRAQEIMFSALLTGTPQCVIDPASE